MTSLLILGIETSCDETATALYDSEKGLIGHKVFSQIDLHNQYGGVVPELASRDHIKKLLPMVDHLIKETGNKVFDIPEGHFCCGSAGTYNLLQNDIAKKLLKNKILNIDKINPEFIATGNIGCITQISNGTKIPILHTVEVIDWYTGGPKPKILKHL